MSSSLRTHAPDGQGNKGKIVIIIARHKWRRAGHTRLAPAVPRPIPLEDRNTRHMCALGCHRRVAHTHTPGNSHVLQVNDLDGHVLSRGRVNPAAGVGYKDQVQLIIEDWAAHPSAKHHVPHGRHSTLRPNRGVGVTQTCVASPLVHVAERAAAYALQPLKLRRIGRRERHSFPSAPGTASVPVPGGSSRAARVGPRQPPGGVPPKAPYSCGAGGVGQGGPWQAGSHAAAQRSCAELSCGWSKYRSRYTSVERTPGRGMGTCCARLAV